MTQSLDTHRRALLKKTISASTLALLASSGLALPRQLLAHWPKNAFNAESVEDALLALLGEAEVLDDDRVFFKVGSPPSYAVNGAAVPVEINSTLENIERILFLVEKNPFPLAMTVDVNSAVKLPFKTLLKIAEDTDVIAVIKAQGKLYRTSRFVEVDVGGCA
jgi:sulfur-oxidizing protein SoxY